MILQLDPPIPLNVEGKGEATAIMVIDYSEEHSLIWVVIIKATGEIWCEPNEKVRGQRNYTMGRTI